jgi:hypothetical protein
LSKFYFYKQLIPCYANTDSSTNASDDKKDAGKLRRLRIQSLKEVHSVEEPTNPEVEFIIQASTICEAFLLFFLQVALAPISCVQCGSQKAV